MRRCRRCWLGSLNSSCATEPQSLRIVKANSGQIIASYPLLADDLTTSTVVGYHPGALRVKCEPRLNLEKGQKWKVSGYEQEDPEIAFLGEFDPHLLQEEDLSEIP